MKLKRLFLPLAALGALVVLGMRFTQAVENGQAAPEIEAGDWFNTKPLSLKKLKGKVVVVEFWATWCPPCMQSIPHLNELHNKFKDRGVVIIGLSNEDKATVEGTVQKLAMAYAVGSGSQTGGAYGVRGIPHAFIVDPRGRISWSGHPMNGLDEAIEATLKATPPELKPPAKEAAPFLLRTISALDQKETAALIKQFESKDFGVREAAEKQLASKGHSNVAQIEAALKNGKGLEKKIRLKRVLAALEKTSRGNAAAERAKKAGPEAEAQLLLLALPELADPLKQKAIDHLKALAGKVEPALQIPNEAGARAVRAVWAKRLNLKAAGQDQEAQKPGEQAIMGRGDVLKGTGQIDKKPQ